MITGASSGIGLVTVRMAARAGAGVLLVARNEEALRQYVRETAGAGTPSTADELGKLAELRSRGTISDEEFRHAKAKLLGRQPEPVSPAYADGRPVPSTT